MTRKEIIENHLKNEYKALTFEYAQDGEVDIFRAKNAELNGLDDDILIEIASLPNHLFFFKLVFDRMPPTEEALERLADFNAKDHWFGASVNSKGYLTLENACVISNEHDIKDTISQLLMHLIKIKDDLLPLTTLTTRD